MPINLPGDAFSRKFPISIKGIVIFNERLVLLKNERDEWELPGGKLELGETSEECVIREVKEELAIDVAIHALIDVWMYQVLDKVNVFIVTFLCKPVYSDPENIQISHEHKEVGLFKPSEMNALKMPAGYKNSIHKGLEKLSTINFR